MESTHPSDHMKRHIVIPAAAGLILTDCFPVVYELDHDDKLLPRPPQMRVMIRPPPDRKLLPDDFIENFKTLIPKDVKTIIAGFVIDALIIRKLFVWALKLANRFLHGNVYLSIYGHQVLFPPPTGADIPIFSRPNRTLRYIKYLQGINSFLNHESVNPMMALYTDYAGPQIILGDGEPIPVVTVSPTDFKFDPPTFPFAFPVERPVFAPWPNPDFDRWGGPYLDGHPTVVKIGPKVKDVVGLWGHVNQRTMIHSTYAHFDGLYIIDIEIEHSIVDIQQFGNTQWRFLAHHLKLIYGPYFETVIKFINRIDEDEDGDVFDVVSLERINPL